MRKITKKYFTKKLQLNINMLTEFTIKKKFDFNLLVFKKLD